MIIPSGVEVGVKNSEVMVKGPKGSLLRSLVPEVTVSVEGNQCLVVQKAGMVRAPAMHGLYRQLIYNMVKGVSEGFTRTLLIQGVGYRATQLEGKHLLISAGYSIPIEFLAPEGITLSLEGPLKIVVSGIDKEKVGQIAAEIRSIRPPEPYKGKGIRYENEQVRRKAGKSGVK